MSFFKKISLLCSKGVMKKTQHNYETKTQNKIICNICCNDFYENEIILFHDNHMACFDCVFNILNSIFGTVNILYSLDIFDNPIIICPVPTHSHNICEHKLCLIKLAKNLPTKKIYRKIKYRVHYLTELYLEQGEFCKECGVFVFRENDNSMFCNGCYKNYCYQCSAEPFHEKQTCLQFENEKYKKELIKPKPLKTNATLEQKIQYKKNKEEYNNKIWKINNTKECPKCKTSIEKYGGCLHMECQKCKYQFCWKSLKSWVICRKTNHPEELNYKCNYKITN